MDTARMRGQGTFYFFQIERPYLFIRNQDNLPIFDKGQKFSHRRGKQIAADQDIIAVCWQRDMNFLYGIRHLLKI